MKRWVANTILTGAGIAFALLAAEAGLRLVGYSAPSFYRADPCCGVSLYPGSSGVWQSEGRAEIEISSQGLRDREHELAKPANTLRIAVLGDSYAEALQVPMEQTFWAVAEQRLQGCAALGGRRAEVINFGVSGYGTGQELQMLRERVWAFDPDLVVLAFLTGNDVRNNSRALEGDPTRPYFRLESGRLVLDDAFLESPQYRAIDSVPARLLIAATQYSRVLQLVNATRKAIKARAATPPPTPQQGAQQAEIGLDNLVYLDPPNEDWREAWAVTEALIAEMAREVDGRGRGFLLTTLSNGIQVLPDPKERQEWQTRIGVSDLLYPDKRIAALARREGIEALTLAPILGRWAEERQTCVHGFSNATLCSGHWNAEGHRLAGEAISARICDMLGPRASAGMQD